MRNVIEWGPLITKDGVTVAKEVELEDRFENMGAQIIKQVATKMSEEAGDVTTTATILARTLLAEGIHSVVAGVTTTDLKRGIYKAVKEIIQQLKQLSVPFDTSEAIAQVGTISANLDVAIGEIIARAMIAEDPKTQPSQSVGEGVSDLL